MQEGEWNGWACSLTLCCVRAWTITPVFERLQTAVAMLCQTQFIFRHILLEIPGRERERKKQEGNGPIDQRCLRAIKYYPIIKNDNISYSSTPISSLLEDWQKEKKVWTASEVASGLGVELSDLNCLWNHASLASKCLYELNGQKFGTYWYTPTPPPPPTDFLSSIDQRCA